MKKKKLFYAVALILLWLIIMLAFHFKVIKS